MLITTRMMIQFLFPSIPQNQDRLRVSPIAWPPFYGFPHSPSPSTPTRSSQLHCVANHRGPSKHVPSRRITRLCFGSPLKDTGETPTRLPRVP